jgi:hypothetical protein
MNKRSTDSIALGHSAHFGLGLFVPATNCQSRITNHALVERKNDMAEATPVR